VEPSADPTPTDPSPLVHRPEVPLVPANDHGQAVESMLSMFTARGWAEALHSGQPFSGAEAASILKMIARTPDNSPKDRMAALEMIRRWSEDTLIKGKHIQQIQHVISAKLDPDTGGPDMSSAEAKRLIVEQALVFDDRQATERGLAAALGSQVVELSDSDEGDD
jgi:hypothetical protein